jgi:type II secretory pathway pseudopilin PulG
MKAALLRDPRAGFTIIEAMVVALVLVALTSVALASNRENPHRLVYHQAQQLRARIAEAVSRAEASGGDALLLADASFTGDARGRFLAASDTAGIAETEVASREWTPFTAGTQWGAGSAVTGPLGDATAGVPRLVRCSAGRGCAMGARGALTYYLTHARDPSAVAAVVLTPDGTAHLYRYLPHTGVWSTEAPR